MHDGHPVLAFIVGPIPRPNQDYEENTDTPVMTTVCRPSSFFFFLYWSQLPAGRLMDQGLRGAQR